MSAPAPVTVRIWGEDRAEKKLTSVLHVLVAGKHAGAIERTGDGTWVAQVHAGLKQLSVSEAACMDGRTPATGCGTGFCSRCCMRRGRGSARRWVCGMRTWPLPSAR